MSGGGAQDWSWPLKADAEGNVPGPAGEVGSPAPRYGNGRTEAQEKAGDSAWIHEGMAAAFPETAGSCQKLQTEG